MTFPSCFHLSNLRRALPLLILTLVFAGLLAGVHALTTAPKTSIAHLESTVRRHEFVQAWVPKPVRDFRPKPWDTYQHLLLNIPFGLLAGVGGVTAARAFRAETKPVATMIILSLAAGWALYSEWRQVALPDRSAGWDDLLANWLGLAIGFGMWSGAAAVSSRIRRSRESGRDS